MSATVDPKSQTPNLKLLITNYALWLGLGLAVVAIVIGALLGFAGVILTLAALAALAAGLWALTNIEIGLWGVIAVITLLPFAALPVKIVFKPTFLDLAVAAVIGVYALQWMTGKRRRLTLTPAHAPIAAFAVLAVFSFMAGRSNGPLTSNLARHFAEMLLAVGFAFIVVDYLDSRAKLERLTRIILIGGTLAALLGIGLYVIPDALAERALSALRVFDYPAGGVLRYIEDNPDNAQRAISTSVDPNVLGGLLAMIGGLLAPQLLTPQPLFKWRWLTVLMFAVVLACLVLTFSRGAMAALGIALAGIALARYRRMLWVMFAVALVIALLPVTQEYVAHFVAGVQGQDLATQMRFGEYKDAFILINRYPFFGVGFAGVPEIDIYLGVSSAYFIMAEEMGLVGLVVFLLSMAVVFGWGFTRRKLVYRDEALAPLWLGAHAGLTAALAVGVVDHYFFNLDFLPAGTLFWIFGGLALAATRLAGEALHQNRADEAVG
jgi:O-antigen ligase